MKRFISILGTLCLGLTLSGQPGIVSTRPANPQDGKILTMEETILSSELSPANLHCSWNGSVLLVSPMQPNTQSSMVAGTQSKWDSALNEVKNSSEYASKNVALAKVHTMFSELLTVSGKLSRDYLGNNVNHPNDFGVRIYAQVVLKTLCGDDFS